MDEIGRHFAHFNNTSATRERDIPFHENFLEYKGSSLTFEDRDVEKFIVLVPKGSLVDCGEVLYHYTNRTGAKGILESRKIWASEFSSLNDPEELSYSRNMIKRRIGVLSSSENLTELSEEIGSISFSDVFISSFSKAGDSLPQWRMYAGEDGVSLGFPRSTLRNVESLASGFALTEVIYDTEEQMRLIDPVVNAMIEIYQSGTGARETVEKFESEIRRIAPALKQPGYSSEREVRIVYAGSNIDKFSRNRSDGSSVNYIQLNLEELFDIDKSVDILFDTVGTAPTDNSLSAIRTVKELFITQRCKVRQISSSMHRFRWS